MKRIALRALLFLLIGAVINVAVAWGSIYWGRAPTGGFRLGDPADPTLWPGTRRAALMNIWRTEDVYNPDTGAADARGIAKGFGSTAVGVPHRSLIWYAPDYNENAPALKEPPPSAPPTWRTGLPAPWTPRSQSWPETRLPIIPVWPGVLLNTVFYGCIAFLGVETSTRFLHCRRIRRGVCPRCAYPIGPSPFCSECGKPVKPRPAAPA